MQIPGLGQFGNQIADAPQIANVPLLSTGQGAQSLGRDLQGIGTSINSEELERQKQANAARLSLTLATTSNQLRDAHDQVARGVLDGSIPSDEAGSQFSAAASKVRQANLDGIPAEQMQMVAPHLETMTGELNRNLAGVVMKRQQSETGDTIAQAGEQWSRQAVQQGPEWASQKFNALAQFAGPAAGWTPAMIDAKSQQFREQATHDFYQGAATTALTSSDIPGLGNVLTDLQGAKGEAMDPQKRQQLIHQVYGWQQMLVARQLRAENAADDAQRIRDNAAGDLYNSGLDLFQKGQAFNPDFIKTLTEAGTGTAHEAEIQGLLSAQALGGGWATKPAPERDAAIARWRAAETTPGVGTDPAQAKAVEALATMNSKLKTAADDNPWSAASAAGRIPDTPTINPADPQSATAVIAQRMQQIGAVEQWVGHKVSPLQPAEVEGMDKLLRTLPPDQAGTMLSTMGKTLGDPDRIAQVAKQLKDKDGDMALAMLYAGAGTDQGRQVAELTLRGVQALKDNAVLIDNTKGPSAGWKSTIATQINGAYPNIEVQENMKRAAFLIMAAGNRDGDSRSVDNAVTLATGGIVDRNGAKIPLPWGMREDAFTKRVDGITPTDLAAQAPDGQVMVGRTPMPLDQFVSTLPKAQLVHAGQGLYNVRAGMQTVTNSAGKRITLTITP